VRQGVVQTFVIQLLFLGWNMKIGDYLKETTENYFLCGISRDIGVD